MTLPYSRLNRDQHEIRILTILPSDGTESDSILADLNIASLYDSPDYEALSYVWGSLDEVHQKQDVFINGKTLSIMPNLGDALRRLRLPDKPRNIWVDAICIDQSNVEEKNFQVPIMGEIYSLASQVIAWFGPSNLDIELAVYLIDYANGTRSMGSELWFALLQPKNTSVAISRAAELALFRAGRGVNELLANSYWTRMWTFQEWQLSRDKTICMCGDLTFESMQIICATASTLQFTALKILHLYDADSTHIGQDMELAQHVQALREIHQSARQLGSRVSPTSFRTCSSRRQDIQWGEMNLRRPLQDTTGLKCSHALDRVYALYGMNPLIREIYPPDYNKPIEKIIIETTMYMINYERDSLAFSLFPFCQINQPGSTLPSWALDIMYVPEGPFLQSTPPQIAVEPARLLHKFTDRPWPFVEEGSAILHLPARRVGICYVAHQFNKSNYIETATFVHQIATTLLPSTPVWGPENVSRRFWEAALGPKQLTHAHMFRDMTEFLGPTAFLFEEEHSGDEIMALFEELCNGRKPTSTTTMRDKIYQELERKLDRLKGAYLLVVMASPARDVQAGGGPMQGFAIGDSNIKDGDIAIVAPGIAQALVIRKDAELEDGEAQEYYRIVGKIAIDGIGESQDSSENPFFKRVLDQPLEEFLIK